MASGDAPGTIDDMEYLETLARRKCMLMPPWVYHIKKDGHLEKLTPPCAATTPLTTWTNPRCSSPSCASSPPCIERSHQVAFRMQ